MYWRVALFDLSIDFRLKGRKSSQQRPRMISYSTPQLPPLLPSPLRLPFSQTQMAPQLLLLHPPPLPLLHPSPLPLLHLRTSPRRRVGIWRSPAVVKLPRSESDSWERALSIQVTSRQFRSLADISGHWQPIHWSLAANSLVTGRQCRSLADNSGH